MEIKLCKKGICLHAKIFFVGEDLLVVVYGGKAHIGSCVLSDRICSKTTNIPKHKDHLVFKVIEKELRKSFYNNMAIVGGIHIEDITKKQIKIVFKLTKKLGKKISKRLFKRFLRKN